MAADKQTRLLAKQLFKLSLVDGAVASDRVAGVLGWVEKHQPRHPLSLLRTYHRYVAAELARSHAVVEHCGPLAEGILRQIEAAMTKKYRRPVSAEARANPALLAGLRIRIGCDVYEASAAGQLSRLEPVS
ncbi:MAG TPA: F0F1 ATP synthase subunit delta [Candidatus Didemnitutus sp.]|nr:F0F1 ATP synthase subunit delta [Candidatus Didemnitutus sp.]